MENFDHCQVFEQKKWIQKENPKLDSDRTEIAADTSQDYFVKYWISAMLWLRLSKCWKEVN